MKATELRVAARGLILVLVTSCGGEPPTVLEDPIATTIRVSPTQVDLDFLGQTRLLVATVLDQNGASFEAMVTWSSDDEDIVSITVGGIVGAVENGSTEVVATVEGLTARVTVTVEQVATQVAVVSGDAQEALSGSVLASPVVAVARDLAGSPVAGATMSARPQRKAAKAVWHWR